jgi:hypothetical protein
MKHLTIFAALAASLFAQSPTANVSTVNIATLRQLGMVTQPEAVDHFQVLVRVYDPKTTMIKVSLKVSVDGVERTYHQIAEVFEYGTNDGELGVRRGAVLEFPVAGIARAVVVGSPVVKEHVAKVAQ